MGFLHDYPMVVTDFVTAEASVKDIHRTQANKELEKSHNGVATSPDLLEVRLSKITNKTNNKFNRDKRQDQRKEIAIAFDKEAAIRILDPVIVVVLRTPEFS
ncbi:hypothetical protein M8C21_030627 [Ambrosia artemisiifolia]|uniref:Uncharacterized protein n=1 Tax=Ambrosia artemisiifolia TaxID=4212 RepID=A0AAD5BT92_AMBAR|nr:hypothetical protein M8C21_030627 [Ambrosia artemisiifolia]